jgi:simple sugar transport system permease protein
MLISGGVAGLAGAIEISGIHHRIYAAFSPGYGFDGIAIALVGQLHPLGISAAALLFGALHSGSVLMQEQAQIPVDVISIISATITCVIAIGPELNPLIGVIRRLNLEKIKWKTSKSM